VIDMKCGILVILATICLVALQSSYPESVQKDELVLVFAGRMPGFGEAIGQIVNESGYEAILVREDSFRSLLTLPQTICVVIAAFNPSDFVFLKEFTPALERYLEEGGSLVGIGSVCSYEDLGDLAIKVFPIRGNTSVMGKRLGDRFGSKLVLSEPVEGISDGMPSSFVVTQNRFVVCKGPSGPLDPFNPGGDVRVVYREEETGAPLVVTFQRQGGGRTVSMPGFYTVNIERLPFYWGRLVKESEFRELVRASVIWASQGSTRYQTLCSSLEQTLSERAEQISRVKRVGEDLSRGQRVRRILFLSVLWMVVAALDFFLVVRFIYPRIRSGA